MPPGECVCGPSVTEGPALCFDFSKSLSAKRLLMVVRRNLGLSYAVVLTTCSPLSS